MIIKLKYCSLCLILCILCTSNLKAQEYDEEKYFEEIAIETNENPDLTMLEYLRENRMNLRNVTNADLSRIPGIDLMMADNIISLVDNNPEISVEEICNMLEIPHEIELILKETTFIRGKSKGKSIQFRSRFRERLQETRGIEEEIYAGPSYDLYNRLLLSQETEIADFYGGVLVKKEPGEIYSESFTSFHLGLHSRKARLIIGDFSFNSGMGLLTWAPFSQNKSWDAIDAAFQRGNGFNPWRSSLQYGNFRGWGGTSNIFLGKNTNLNIRAFYSYKNLAGSLDEESGEITSIYISGLYRTENEIAKQNAVVEEIGGLNLEIVRTNFTLGFNSMYVEFSKPINSQSITTFKGKEGLLGSVYSFYRYYDFMLGGEFGFDAKQNLGAKFAAIYKLKYIEFAMHYRNYDKNFRSPYGNNFGEFYSPANESGLYFGSRIRASNSVVLNTYIDLFRSHGRTYTIPGTIKGTDKMLELQYTGLERILITFKGRHKEITSSVTDSDKLRHLVQKDKYQLRADWAYKPNPRLMFRCRVEYVYLEYESKIPNESGVGAFFEFKADASVYLTFGGRISLFDTDSYNSSIWQYESVMPGYSNSPALFGAGNRSFVYVNLKPIEQVTLRLRYADTSKNYVKSVSSAYDEIAGNAESRVFVTLEFTL